MAHTGRNRPGGALSHLIPVDPWSVSHTIERIVARTQRLDRKPHPNSTYDAHTVPETIAHERPPRRHLGPMLLSSRRDALRVQCDDYMEAMQHYLNIRSPGVSTRS